MLAYMHRVDVDELQHLREHAQQAIERIKVQKFVAQSGIVHDGSAFETAKRKTSFLLRHFFALDEWCVRPSCVDTRQATDVADRSLSYRLSTSSPQQERLLYDVIEDWQCTDSSSEDEIASVWASVTHHIEQSCTLTPASSCVCLSVLAPCA